MGNHSYRKRSGKYCNILVAFLIVFLGHLIPGNCQILTYEFTNYSIGSQGASDFTTNNFTAAGIGTENRIWVGSQYGGLYTMDDDGTELWFKSTQLTNVFINHIATDPYGGIWIAQSGTQSSGGNSNLGGALNYFPTKYAVDMKLYTIPGPVNNANLFSRNVRSVYVDKSSSSPDGELKKVWIAQGTYITNFNTQRGGVNFGMNPQPPLTIRNVQGFTLQSGTPICESVEGNDAEIWVGVRLNQGRSQILRYKKNGDLIGEYSHLNTTVLTQGFFPNSIHFDNFGYKWIGLREGGIRILTPNAEWIAVDFPLTVFPAGTNINHNAITSDDLGNVYIGTSNGLLVFKSQSYFGSNPANPDDYTRLTTTEGLVNNNVRGMVFDKKNGRLIIATAGGISFLVTRPDNIVGTVFNVSAKYEGTNSLPQLHREVLSGGAHLDLFEGNSFVENQYVSNSSIFEFEKAQDNKVYKLDAIGQVKSDIIKYSYNNVRNRSFLTPIEMPFGLIDELKVYKPKLTQKEIEVAISAFKFKLPIKTDPQLTGYEDAWQHFLTSEGITEDHVKQLNNLANYYASITTWNNLGDSSVSIAMTAISSLIPIIQTMIDKMDAISKAKKNPALKNADIPDPSLNGMTLDEFLVVSVNSFKALRSSLNTIISFLYSKVDVNPEIKKVIDFTVTFLNDSLDILITFIDEELKEDNKTLSDARRAAGKSILDGILMKGVNILFSSALYSYYLESIHFGFVPTASANSKNSTTDESYEEIFNRLINPAGTSITRFAADTMSSRKETIDGLNKAAGYVDIGAQWADVGSNVRYIPGFQALGAGLKALSTALKAAKIGLAGVAFYQGATGTYEILNLSKKILNPEKKPDNIPLNGEELLTNFEISPQNLPPSLMPSKTNYFTALNNLKSIYTGSTPDAQLGNMFRAYLSADSAYIGELDHAMNYLWALVDSASPKIPGFAHHVEILADTFLIKQFELRDAFGFDNIVIGFDGVSPEIKAELLDMANNIMVLNDSAINRMQNLITAVNNSGINTGAHLKVSNHKNLTNFEPGSSGTVRYTFKNFGTVPQHDVSFKLSPPTRGFVLNSSDTLFAGTLAPGDTVGFSFNYTAPMEDSVGKFYIKVNASNGHFTDVSGSLFIIEPNKYYTVQSGNWSDPETWSHDEVPTAANKVFISHDIVIDVDAACKQLSTFENAIIEIKPGKKLDIKE